jgi:very-short-patch-repair endonuclease
MAKRAQHLRNTMTDHERLIWYALRGWREQGFHFRRQAPIGPYIVDFVCHRYQFVIEVDGSQHGWCRNRRNDARRDAWLRRQGYEVMRIWNVDVRENLDGVLDGIHAAVSERRRRQAHDQTLR